MTREDDPLKQTPACELDRDNRATREPPAIQKALEILTREKGELRAEIAQLRAAAIEIDRYLLVIESAVRNADPSQHSAVLAALQANRAALERKP